jgi:Fe(3+) dicitrate transport protein
VGRAYKVWNRGESDAVAVFVSEKLSWERLSLNIGVRFENIEGELTDRSTGLTREADQDFVSPGVGLFYKLSDNLGLLAGVYRGFSPAGPGSGVDPEESINYEYGFRYTNDTFHGEVIGFFSDYESLIGRCRVSDSSCVAGEEFNGGEVEIAGVEVTGALEWPITEFVTFSAALTYTYTDSSFESSFLSNFSQWGLVREGDELPYLPEQTGQLDLSLASNRWGLKGTVKFQEQMREEPGSVSVDDGLHADGYVTVGVVASYFHSDRTTIQLIVQNATDEAAIISHRPFGARPNRPRAIIGRLKYRF